MEIEESVCVRPYSFDSDFSGIRNALFSEGFGVERHSYQTDKTYITPYGFFSYRIEHNYPRLTHFFVDKGKRSFRTAWKHMQLFKQLIRENGFRRFIAEVPREQGYLEKFVKYLGGDKPFTVENGDSFYLVHVDRVEK